MFPNTGDIQAIGQFLAAEPEAVADLELWHELREAAAVAISGEEKPLFPVGGHVDRIRGMPCKNPTVHAWQAALSYAIGVARMISRAPLPIVEGEAAPVLHLPTVTP
ncbi:MAG: hypothetical protein ACPHK8_00710 [Thermoplasmatota archaeon]